MIDDTNCKPELDNLLEKYSDDLLFLLSDEEATSKLDAILDNLQRIMKGYQQLTIRTTNGIENFQLGKIIYLKEEKESDVISLKTDQDQLFLCRDLLDNIEKKLCNHGFFRLNQEFLINMDFLAEYKKAEPGIVLLTTGEVLELDIIKEKAFTEYLNQYQS